MIPERAVVVSCDSVRLAKFRARWEGTGCRLPLDVYESRRSEDPKAGCWAAHVAVLTATRGPTLVLEDDAMFLDDFTVSVGWPDDCEVGLYGYRLGRTRWHVTSGAVRRVVDAYQTHAYLAATPPTLAAKIGSVVPDRHFTWEPGWRSARRYALVPPTVVQES